MAARARVAIPKSLRSLKRAPSLSPGGVTMRPESRTRHEANIPGVTTTSTPSAAPPLLALWRSIVNDASGTSQRPDDHLAQARSYRWHTIPTDSRKNSTPSPPKTKVPGAKSAELPASTRTTLSSRGLWRNPKDGKRFVREAGRLGVAGDWRGVLALLRVAEGDGRAVNQIMYNATIAALAKSGRWEEATSTLE